MNGKEKKIVKIWKRIGVFLLLILLNSCGFQSADDGNPALKLFSALGICLAAVFLIFFLVVKIREKE